MAALCFGKLQGAYSSALRVLFITGPTPTPPPFPSPTVQFSQRLIALHFLLRNLILVLARKVFASTTKIKVGDQKWNNQLKVKQRNIQFVPLFSPY